VLEPVEVTEWSVDPLTQERIADERGTERPLEIRPMTFSAVAVESDVAMRGLILRVPTVAGPGVGGKHVDAGRNPSAQEGAAENAEISPTRPWSRFIAHDVVLRMTHCVTTASNCPLAVLRVILHPKDAASITWRFATVSFVTRMRSSRSAAKPLPQHVVTH
jgi:hypothetical protein